MKRNCLMPIYADKFVAGLKSGGISPDTLNRLSSSQRQAYLAKYVGTENAKWVNTEYESKLLLKNQQAGLVNWAKQVGGLSEPARNDIIKRISRLEKALTPSDENALLEDIVEKRLSVSVSEDEAKTIIDLTDKIKGAEKGTKEYGQDKQRLMKYLREHGVKDQVHPVSDVLSVLRSIKTGFDLSASLRQGAAYFGTKQWRRAFVNMFRYAKSETALDNLEAEMYASKYSDEVLAVKRDLGLTMLGETFTQREEEFASKLIKKVPMLENSARAYEGFLNDLRFRRFVSILEQLDKAGGGITKDQDAMRDIARVIAAASGRGTLGTAEGAARSLATVLFSPRWIASRIQILTNPIATTTPVARREAATALARLAGISVSIIGLAAMAGADVDPDPRSADFGKIKVGNTRFDLTAGLGQYITLLSRIATGETKSSVSGKITKLNTGQYGQRTKWSLLGDFLSNKTSPIGSVIRDALKGETFDGEPIALDNLDANTMRTLADQLITPMIWSEAVDAFVEATGDNAVLMGVAAGAASMFGVSTSSYQWTPRGAKWDILKKSNPDEYERRVARARVEYRRERDRLENSPDFIAAPETGENSQAAKIDALIRKKSNPDEYERGKTAKRLK